MLEMGFSKSQASNAIAGMNKSWQDEYMHRYYLSIPGWQNGTHEFHLLCKRNIPEGAKVLEIGAGPSNSTSRFLKSLGELHGVDIDTDVKSNDALASAGVIENDCFPYSEASFDACVSNYVLEHVADVNKHLHEVQRVLKPGGVYIFRTPNMYHYAAMVARFTPYWFHKLVANALRNRSEDDHDPYPTEYKFNTKHDIHRHIARFGLIAKDLRMVEKQPSYGMNSRLLFRLFMLYERAVNGTDKLAMLRSNIFGVVQKSETLT